MSLIDCGIVFLAEGHYNILVRFVKRLLKMSIAATISKLSDSISPLLSRLHAYRVSLGLLWIALLLIHTILNGDLLSDSHSITGAVGRDGFDTKLIYFFYYLGLFPAWTTVSPLMPNAEFAQMILEKMPEKVFMNRPDVNLAQNDYLAFLNLLPPVLVTGDYRDASVMPLNIMSFSFALLLFFMRAARSGVWIIGLVTSSLLIVHPLQSYEVFHRPDVFGWPITINLLVLALLIPYQFRQGSVIAFFACTTLSALAIACTREFRADVLASLGSLTVLTLFAKYFPIRVKLVAWLLALGCFFTSTTLITNWGVRLVEKTHTILEQHGANAECAFRLPHHDFWHPFLVGTADFDTQFNTQFKDELAFELALPTLQERYGISATPEIARPYCWIISGPVDNDCLGICPSPQGLPEYYEVIKEIAQKRVLENPGWYLGILANRALRILKEPIPIIVPLTEHAVPFSTVISNILLLFYVLWMRCKNWTLLIASMATLACAFLVYSDGGMMWYGYWPYLLLGLILQEVSDRFKT